MMSGYVYILQDDRGSFYIGSTDNVDRRVQQHLRGYAKTTARMENPKVVLIQEYRTLAQARKIESRIKKLKRKDYVEKMVTEGKIHMQ